MKVKLILASVALSMALTTTAYANRAVRIDVKDVKESASRARAAKDVSRSVKDITGSEKLSTTMERMVNEASRLDSKSQVELVSAINACMKGLETYSGNKSNQVAMSKVEDVVSATLSAAFAIKANGLQNKQTEEISTLLFQFSGDRLKEKLENQQIVYDLDKMQRVAEMVSAKIGRQNLTEKEISELYEQIARELDAKTLEEVIKCKA